MNRKPTSTPPAESIALRSWLLTAAVVLLIAVGLYVNTAWAVFQYRNPKANRMAIYRDFSAVVNWEMLETYQ